MATIAIEFDQQKEHVHSSLLKEGSLNVSRRFNDMGEMSDSQMETERTHASPQRCKLVISVIIALIIGVVGGVILLSLKIHWEANQERDFTGALSEAQTGNEEIKREGGFIDTRINFDTSECKGSDCTRCRTRVPSPARDHGEHFHCGKDIRVKNSSCYECNNKCYIVAELRAETHLRCRGREVPSLCCAISQMLENSSYCGEGGEYLCYHQSQRTPQCQCPFGRTGDRCQYDKKATLICECYDTRLMACGQESMQDCGNITDWSSSMSCQMYNVIDGKQHNCRCRRKEDDDDDDDDDDDLNSCSNPDTDAHVSNVDLSSEQTLSGD